MSSEGSFAHRLDRGVRIDQDRLFSLPSPYRGAVAVRRSGDAALGAKTSRKLARA